MLTEYYIIRGIPAWRRGDEVLTQIQLNQDVTDFKCMFKFPVFTHLSRTNK